MTRIVCISDTHDLHDALEVPDGDVLLHAGDFTGNGAPERIEAFDDFLGRLPHAHKVVIAGNHDFLFEREPERARALLRHAVYLEDSETSVAGLRIWGSPWQPRFFDWAFNLDRGSALADKWARIPQGIDILMTHGPPFEQGDRTARGERVGCDDLRLALRRIRPRLHVFGHIHEGHGVTHADGIIFVNASSCDRRNRPLQPAIVLEWTEGGPVVIAPDA